MNIVLLESVHTAADEALGRNGNTVRRIDRALSSDELKTELADAQVVGLRSKTQLTADVIESLPNLVAIGCFCIGTNQVDLAAARDQGVAVFNAPFSNTRSVAELTMAEIIALHRRLFDKSMALHKGEWDKSAEGAHEVRGRTLGIVGYGHIGSQLSVLAEFFGLRVKYFDIASKLPIGNAQPVAVLDNLLESCDIVSVHVPATERTRDLFGAKQFAKMKPGSFFINNARGSVVDLDALAEALRTGHLAGAAVDVYPEEPEKSAAPFRCPLAGMPNVILTPHIGGSTEEAQHGIAEDVAAKLNRYLDQGSTAACVNLPEVDLPSLRKDQFRILHFHRNVPGVLSKMHRVLADFDVNINAEYLQSDAHVSYVILDVDRHHEDAVIEGLEKIPETIRMRGIR